MERSHITEETRKKLSDSHKGIPNTEEQKRKISEALKGIKRSPETRKKMSDYAKRNGRTVSFKGRHHSIESKRKISESCMDTDRAGVIERSGARVCIEYKKWAKEVKTRDKYKCRIADENCSDGIIAHHILGFASYPELRYQTNNGITLCHAHHPRGRAKEIKLSPYFQDLVSLSNV